MVPGIRTIIYPVKDVTLAKALYGKLLGVQPYADQPYYVGFRLGEQEIGLDPNGHSKGMTMPVVYYDVQDIRKSLQMLVDAWAQIQQDTNDVGGGMLIATAKDADGNLVGLRQWPQP